MNHNLKIKSEYFKKICDEKKRFLLIKNDRDFKVDDLLILYEIDENGNGTGKFAKRKIFYILKDCPEGLKDGYCILSLGFVRC